MAIKTFTTGEVLTAADTNTFLANAGLDYIGAVTLNAVTNNISNVFSSTYQSYRVVISGLNNATTTTRRLNIRFRTGSDDNSANYSGFQTFGYGSPGTTGFGGETGQAQGLICSLSNTATAGAGMSFDIWNPNTAAITTWAGTCITYQLDVVGFVLRTFGGAMNTTTQYTGFSIIGTTDALSGTVRVYGYRQA